MRVTFEVQGQNRIELESAAARVLESFTNRQPAWMTISAEPMIQSSDGTVSMWKGEVEAQV